MVETIWPSSLKNGLSDPLERKSSNLGLEGRALVIYVFTKRVVSFRAGG